jgi:hypothetical protein
MPVLEGSRNEALWREGMRLASDAMLDDSIDAFIAVLNGLRVFNTRECLPPKNDGDVIQLAYRCVSAAAKLNGDEQDVKLAVFDRLSPHFHIHEEVWGTHWSGKRLRIDAIVSPKDDSQWKTKSPFFGLEFKNFRGFNPSLDMKDYTKWWSQCHDYAETDFDGFGLVYVFSYNGFSSYRTKTKNPTTAAFAVRFWGRLGVGELMPNKHHTGRSNLTLMMQSNKIWSEVDGVKDGARISMERKFGSR